MFDESGEAFHQAGFYANQGATPESQGEPLPEYLWPVPDPDALIALPPADQLQLAPIDFRTLTEERRSHRRYDVDSFLSPEELSYLLWLTQGVKKVSEKKGLTLRTVPSAGCRHPFETYVAIRRVQKFDPGIYHYIAHLHALLPFKLGVEALDSVAEAARKQSHVQTAALNFIWTAIPYRTSWRYGARAYRYLYLDAGHVCQNLYLAAESIACGVCAIGAFEDQLADDLLALDGRSQFTIYMASLGRKLKPDIPPGG